MYLLFHQPSYTMTLFSSSFAKYILLSWSVLKLNVFCCICLITITRTYTCRFVSTIRNALTHMNAHTNALVHTTTHHAHATHNTMCPQDGYCPLYFASQQGHDRIVEMLLQAGATVDLQSKVEKYYLFFFHLVVPCALFIVH